MGIKTKIPWQAKIAAKLLLSRIPLGYSFWRQLALFQHGQMEQPSYAYRVFSKHFDRVDFPRHGGGFVGLELGPGDSLFSAMILHAFGASGSYLVDSWPFARSDLEPYRAMENFLLEKGLPAPEMRGINSLEELLATCSAQYLTNGLSSLRTIPYKSIDFVYSQAVLEHIRRAEFLNTMLEIRRVIRDDGVCSHRVDLRDHLDGALNNLRFSERFWESDFMARSGFYTNRIRFSEMLQIFRQANFDVEVVGVDRWDKQPTPREKLAIYFRNLPENELCISGFDVILRPV